MRNAIIATVVFCLIGGCALFGETEKLNSSDAGADVNENYPRDAETADNAQDCPDPCPETLVVSPEMVTIAVGGRAEMQLYWEDAIGRQRSVESFQIEVTPEELALVEGRAIIGGVSGSGTISVITEDETTELRLVVTARWTGLAAGLRHGCGILAGGKTYCWGRQRSALGTGFQINSIFAAQADTQTPFQSICALSKTSVALDSVGGLHGWGRAREGQPGSRQYGDMETPRSTSTASRFRLLDCGYDHACGLTFDNGIRCWGANRLGEVDPSDPGREKSPRGIADQFDDPTVTFIDVAAGANHSCAVARDGAVWCWGDNASGQLGVADPLAGPLPVMALPADVGAVDVTAGLDHTCAIVTNGEVEGEVQCWGANRLGQLGAKSDPERGAVSRITSDRPIAILGETIGNTTCAIDVDGRVGCWGDNSSGQLGAGDSLQRTGDVVWRDDLGEVATVVAGGGFTCVLTVAGSILCWGTNDSWQQGRWDAEQLYTPRPLPDPLNSRFVTVDPAGTYLINSSANDPTVVELDTVGVLPGDLVDITMVNSYEQGDDDRDDDRDLVGVFSSSDELLGRQERNRVVGAIDAGEDFDTSQNSLANAVTDIPEDFDARSVQIVVPEGARFLFLAVEDSRFEDNTDPGNDFGARITVLPPLGD